MNYKNPTDQMDPEKIWQHFIIFKALIKCNVNELDADIQCTVCNNQIKPMGFDE